ncbi:MAG: bifunctional diaminohydroxyphosphoribosylaminopyrimidine deaminase/5-amino-6-(5-phosphoribosylamino)uracil reductase RibD [Alphaproteobacteria bacterium]|nr:bifunctional diaminohydroxyphosphoribosylaminopyrimidine deaminase/5-amino-6-(5-phosphoribosylamino)uracil reductase RibD [Alphaproteobacteria bacterium]
MTVTDADIWHMRSALNLARTGLGRTWPNPTVGCVLVKEGKIIARARTADGGRPHAEAAALLEAGEKAKGAIAYVTLEPCSHHGKTPPCVVALTNAGVARVVIGTLDPDDRVSGRGVAMLKDAGIDVVVSVLEEEVRTANKGYFLKQESRRPLITLKTASTLDSKIATQAGESKWITGSAARGFAHIERAQHDAILVGVNTVLADNPSLTARVPGFNHQGVRIVLDTNLKLKDDEQLFKNTKENPVWILTACDVSEADHLIQRGAKIITVPKKNDRVDLQAALKALTEEGLTSVLVEGGAEVVTSFLKIDLFDRLLWFRARTLLGSDAKNSVSEMQISSLDKMINLNHVESRSLGKDMLDIYERA